MSEAQKDIYDEMERLLNPHEKLKENIYDDNGHMYPDVRAELLNKAQFLINQTIANVPGIVVDDICLVGTKANYLYYENSDTDIKIIIRNESCPFLTKDSQKLFKFANFMVEQFYSKNHAFYFDDGFVDMRTIDDVSFCFMGVYSLQDDHWIIKPERDLTMNLDKNKIMKKYEEGYIEVRKFIEDFVKVNGRYRTQDCDAMLERYYTEFLACGKGPEEYVVYKLLKYNGIMKMLRDMAIVEYSKALSI